MATLTADNPTLLDWKNSLDPDGSVAAVIELLNQTNEILEDATYIEGNLPTGHRTTIRTGLPTPTWRQLYQGVQPTKSTRAQVTEACGLLEDYSEVDAELAALNGNTAEFMLSESRAHIEGMNQSLAETLFYGNSAINPERFTGLSARYNDLSAANAENIIDAQGSGSDNGSIWLVVWSPETVQMLVPKGSQAGLKVENKGKVTSENAGGSGKLLEVYRMFFQMKAGLCVKDWRYAVRIANIDKSDLTADASSGANLPELMFQALELIPSLSMGRAAFYMSRDMRTKFRQQYALLTKNSTLASEDTGGKMQSSFQGVPVRRVDRLATDEAQVT